jgi:hypothetical protein
MVNTQSNSCPNCREFVLSTDSVPLNQSKTPNEITQKNNDCKVGFELILKPVSQKPLCVTPQTASTLILRGWISEND